MVELVGLEPTTSSLRTRRSPKLSYSPKACRCTKGFYQCSPDWARCRRCPTAARDASPFTLLRAIVSVRFFWRLDGYSYPN